MKYKKIVSFVLLSVVVIGLFSVVSQMKANSVSKNVATQGIKMKTYTDPANLFSIQIPESWQATENIGTQTYASGTPHERVLRVEVIQLISKENAGVNIQMNEGKASCDSVPPANTTLAGLPATYGAKNDSLKLFTNDAAYTISYIYPRVGKFYGPRRFVSPTSIVREELESNKAIIDAVINSFSPKNLSPLKC